MELTQEQVQHTTGEKLVTHTRHFNEAWVVSVDDAELCVTRHIAIFPCAGNPRAQHDANLFAAAAALFESVAYLHPRAHKQLADPGTLETIRDTIMLAQGIQP